MYMKTEILFPTQLITQLRDACGPGWRKLVEEVAGLPETHPDRMAFGLMMARLDGCLECETDSFRAMRGCSACALQTVRRYRNNERDLLALHKAALKDVREFLRIRRPALLEDDLKHIPLTPVRRPRTAAQPAAAR